MDRTIGERLTGGGRPGEEDRGGESFRALFLFTDGARQPESLAASSRATFVVPPLAIECFGVPCVDY